MRPEKKYLVDEVNNHLDKSDYVFLTDFNTLTVDETSDLRGRLSEHEAEFHVVKNTILRVAARDRGLPEVEDWYEGPTAIITGGRNAPAVAKVLGDFRKQKDKVEVKGGILGNAALSGEEVMKLVDLPSEEVLKAQLLGLLMQPATKFAVLLNTVPTQMVTVLNAVPSGFLSVLKQREAQLQ